MSSANFCNICCDTKKLMVTCPYCQFESCNTCAQKYLLDNISLKCMSCSKQWSLEFVQNSFPTTFVNKDYKKHRENILFEKEKALLPQTQVLLEQRKKEAEIKRRIQEHQAYINALENEIRRLNGRTEEEVIKANKNARTIPCIKSSCRGFINVTSSAKLECGLCNTKVCKDCREELKTDEHKCNPSTVESVKMLEKECKRCPKCACLIYKIAGCDQMWCVQCKTAFSWKTGNIETGVVHNPHYWEYARSQGREDAEVRRQFGGGNPVNPCDNNPNNFRFDQMIRDTHFYKKMSNMIQDLSHIARIIVHTRQVELRRYNVDMNDTANNRDIRMKYLEKKIDEDSFKTTIQRRQKLNEFKQEMHQILTTFTTVSIEVFTRYYYHIIGLSSNPHITQCKIDMIIELSNILNFTVNSINKVSKRFKYTFPSILKTTIFFQINKHIRQLAKKMEEETKIVVKLEDMPDCNCEKEKKKKEEKKEEMKEEMKTTYRRRNDFSDDEDSGNEYSDYEEDDEKSPSRPTQNIDRIIISDDEEDIPLSSLKKK